MQWHSDVICKNLSDLEPTLREMRVVIEEGPLGSPPGDRHIWCNKKRSLQLLVEAATRAGVQARKPEPKFDATLVTPRASYGLRCEQPRSNLMRPRAWASLAQSRLDSACVDASRLALRDPTTAPLGACLVAPKWPMDVVEAFFPKLIDAVVNSVRFDAFAFCFTDGRNAPIVKQRNRVYACPGIAIVLRIGERLEEERPHTREEEPADEKLPDVLELEYDEDRYESFGPSPKTSVRVSATPRGVVVSVRKSVGKGWKGKARPKHERAIREIMHLTRNEGLTACLKADDARFAGTTPHSASWRLRLRFGSIDEQVEGAWLPRVMDRGQLTPPTRRFQDALEELMKK